MAPSLVAPSSVLQLNLSSGFYTVLVFFFAFLCFVLLWGYCRRISSGHRTAAAAAALHGHRLMQQLQHHPHGRFFPTAASTPLPSMPYGSIKGVRATETGNPPEDCVVCLTKFEEGEGEGDPDVRARVPPAVHRPVARAERLVPALSVLQHIGQRDGRYRRKYEWWQWRWRWWW
uniref:Uncharacterized protein n=1 Tax=Ananas comosus var. bracteatus TaxID=296719 RepID=A0A6V7QPW7_ANACO|nr:unnamed protein product [Ananas comosus var. bracteatus]